MKTLEAAVELVESAPLPVWAKEDVARALDYVLQVWYPDDDPLLVESELTAGRVKGIVDLLLDTDPPTLVDWKLSRRLDAQWELRMARSNQLRLYVALLHHNQLLEGPVAVEARGINPEERVQSKVVRYLVTPQEAQQVLQWYQDFLSVLEALDPSKPWLRDPSGCRRYGSQYACKFEPYCWEGAELAENRQEGQYVSFSSVEDFLRCPERYRLTLLTGQEDTSEALETGKVFHEAVAVLYRAKLPQV